jgi:diaminopimelate decarboxylase
MDPAPGPARTIPFLTPALAAAVRERFGTPCYVYDRATLEAAARSALSFPAPFGFTLRYAMKANSSAGVLGVFRNLGLHIDASSDFEVERALRAGFAPSAIQLTSQMPPRRLREHLQRGILFNACSTKRTNTGGPAASFGIWHEYLGEVTAAAARHGVRIRTLHSHIGSGTDPEMWKRITRMTLDLAGPLPEVVTVNLGGGFKVGRMPEEASTDLADVGAHVRQELLGFRERHGRALRLEIEPGTFLVASAGAVVATCVDVVDTGRDGYLFAKLDTGMTEVTRPSLYGAQHPIDVLAAGREPAEVVFVGPCCESGDILTPAPGDPEALAPRWVPRPQIGDLVLVGGAGAYCASMSTINYNSYPQAPEVLLERDGSLRLLRRRQSPDEIWANEV